MSRYAHLGIGLFLLLFLLFWCFFGVVLYIGYGAFGFAPDAYVVLWILVFLGSGYGAFASFKRVRKSAQHNRQNATAPTVAKAVESNRDERKQDLQIDEANERLERILGKSKRQ